MENLFKNPKKRKLIEWAALVLLIALLLFVLWQIVFGLETIRHQGIRPMHPRRLAPGPKMDISHVRSWMTFAFLDTAFNLPQNYLKSELKIANSRYPNLSIDALAKEQNTNSTIILQQTIDAISRYLK